MHTAPSAPKGREVSTLAAPTTSASPARRGHDDAAIRRLERFFFEAANRERAAEGLPQLKWDEALAVAARKHAALMADEEELAHRLPGEPALNQRVAQAGGRFSTVGENIAIGPEAPEIHSGWMKSPGHRANILGADYNALGVGVVERDGQFYAVEDFSRAVENLNIEQQEKKVGALLSERGFRLSPSRDDAAQARKICEGGSANSKSMNPPRHSMEILQYETPDLSSLPPQLERALHSKNYRDAAVGACSQEKVEGSIPRFRVVILLFPQV